MPLDIEKLRRSKLAPALRWGHRVALRSRDAARDALVCARWRKELRNRDFSIISCDCVGGVLAKELRVRMNFPTRNFYFEAADYVRFCSDLPRYLEAEPMPSGPGKSAGGGYPMATLDDVTLHLVHYDSFEDFREQWTRRRGRVRWDNLFFVMNDRNGCTEDDIRAFDRLPWANKVCLTHCPWPQYESVFYVRGFEGESCVGTLTDYESWLSLHRIYDQFDFVSWLNAGATADLRGN